MHPLGLLWMSDQPVTEVATYTTHREHNRCHPCPKWDTNQQSQQPRPCSRTLAVHQTTYCEKAPLSINPLAFTHNPPVVIASNLFREPDVRKFNLAFVLTKCVVVFGKEICDFRLSCGRLSL
jgi:hypothetical protein